MWEIHKQVYLRKENMSNSGHQVKTWDQLRLEQMSVSKDKSWSLLGHDVVLIFHPDCGSSQLNKQVKQEKLQLYFCLVGVKLIHLKINFNVVSN